MTDFNQTLENFLTSPVAYQRSLGRLLATGFLDPVAGWLNAEVRRRTQPADVTAAFVFAVAIACASILDNTAGPIGRDIEAHLAKLFQVELERQLKDRARF